MAVDANGEEYADNDERAIFYARGVLETVKKLRWCPELIHCHGWMSALVPIYIKKAYADEPSFCNTKVIFSLFADDFKKECQGDLATKIMVKGIETADVDDIVANPSTCEDLCKLAVAYADGLIISSENVNENVVAFARQRGIPVLEYQGSENYADAYDQFFQQIMDAE
jgi:starch synthase